MARTLNQILKTEKPDIVARARTKADAMLLDIHLSEIRAMMEKTQSEIAEALGVSQPTIAGMEKAGRDIKLSSLKRYIEGGGGKVNISIRLPNGESHSFAI